MLTIWIRSCRSYLFDMAVLFQNDFWHFSSLSQNPPAISEDSTLKAECTIACINTKIIKLFKKVKYKATSYVNLNVYDPFSAGYTRWNIEIYSLAELRLQQPQVLSLSAYNYLFDFKGGKYPYLVAFWWSYALCMEAGLENDILYLNSCYSKV